LTKISKAVFTFFSVFGVTGGAAAEEEEVEVERAAALGTGVSAAATAGSLARDFFEAGLVSGSTAVATGAAVSTDFLFLVVSDFFLLSEAAAGAAPGCFSTGSSRRCSHSLFKCHTFTAQHSTRQKHGDESTGDEERREERGEEKALPFECQLLSFP
jgi:hypothetical protein